MTPLKKAHSIIFRKSFRPFYVHILQSGIGSNHISVELILDGLSQYIGVWPNEIRFHVSLNITTIFVLLKPLVSPTYQHFWIAEKVVIFWHITSFLFWWYSQRLSKKVQLLSGFSIDIFVFSFLPISVFEVVKHSHIFPIISFKNKQLCVI